MRSLQNYIDDIRNADFGILRPVQYVSQIPVFLEVYTTPQQFNRLEKPMKIRGLHGFEFLNFRVNFLAEIRKNTIDRFGVTAAFSDEGHPFFSWFEEEDKVPEISENVKAFEANFEALDASETIAKMNNIVGGAVSDDQPLTMDDAIVRSSMLKAMELIIGNLQTATKFYAERGIDPHTPGGIFA